MADFVAWVAWVPVSLDQNVGGEINQGVRDSKGQAQGRRKAVATNLSGMVALTPPVGARGTERETGGPPVSVRELRPSA